MVYNCLQPFLSDPNAQVPPPIIPQILSSRPPVYSPELRALLTSEVSRTTKALKILDPSKLPNQRIFQADLSCEEAILLGGPSKRREKNLVKRFFRQEVQKVYPPLGVDVQEGQTPEEVGIRGGAAQGLGLQKDVELIIGAAWKSPQLTRRERQDKCKDTLTSQQSQSEQRPSRWLRRRYQSLLSRLPRLMFTPGANAGLGHYAVERSSLALGDIYSTRGRLLPVAAASQLAWFESAPDQSRVRK